MSRSTPDDQLKFLLSCVRHSNNGKIDFVEVAQECGVVSKGAAAKRYERLLKANGIHPSGGPTEKPLPPTVPKQRSRIEIAKAAAAKRRKIEGDIFNCKNEDEDDFTPLLKAEPSDGPRIKAEPGTGFQPYPYQQIARPSLPPFFPQRPMPQMPIRNPYVPQYNSMQSHVPERFSIMPPPTVYPVPPLTSQQMTNSPRPSMSISKPQTDTAPHLQSTDAVPEDEITYMWDEFCSQDMFKVPAFDNPSPEHNTTTADTVSTIPEEQVLAQPVEAEISPRTTKVVVTVKDEVPEDDVLVSQTSEPDIILSTSNQSSHIQVSDTEPIPLDNVEVPLGSGFDNCILITD